MSRHKYIQPYYIFFLILPAGISNGFVTVVLPYFLTKNGIPVAITASIVAIAVSANVWRFLWGPIVDISLSLKKWFWIGISSSIVTLLLLCFIPLRTDGVILLCAIVFISQVAATISLLPVNGFMANCIDENKKGKASGWYQAGSLTGTGLGGGAGLWIATQYSIQTAGIILCVASFLFALFIFLFNDIKHNKEIAIIYEIKNMASEILAMIKIPVSLFVVFLVMMPIGSGAMSNLWSAIAQDWKADVSTVVLVTGILSGLISALGCVAGGFIADKWGVWVAYLGSGTLCAIVAFIIALLPLYPIVYIGGVLAYAFSTGLVYAAFTSLTLYAIGKKHVATKFSIIASLGNLPVAYVTSLNGWVHDKFNSRYMLLTEAVLGMAFVILFFFILKRMMNKKLIPAVVE